MDCTPTCIINMHGLFAELRRGGRAPGQGRLGAGLARGRLPFACAAPCAVSSARMPAQGDECVCERERETGSVFVFACEIGRVCVRESATMCVCVRERVGERERVCVWERERQHGSHIACAAPCAVSSARLPAEGDTCVCVREREREREKERERERERACVCERERVHVYVFVCVCACVCVCVCVSERERERERERE